MDNKYKDKNRIFVSMSLERHNNIFGKGDKKNKDDNKKAQTFRGYSPRKINKLENIKPPKGGSGEINKKE